jgi:dynein heavy chain
MVVQVLKAAKSPYLDAFTTLSDGIEKGSEESTENLRVLMALFEPCTHLAAAEPKTMPAILKDVLMRIRAIWSVSKFYCKTEALTGLLRKVSNQIIIQCSHKIQLKEIYDGDVETSIVNLTDSIACGVAWKQIFEATRRAVQVPSKANWSFDATSIFAQVDAFVQRCRDLIEVCEGQILFARKSSKVPAGQKAPLPAFGGCRGPETEKSLLEIEASFDKFVDKLRHLEYDVLDVKANKWHDDFLFFTNGVKDLEVMFTNVLSGAFESVSTLQNACELLIAFFHLTKRPSMKLVIDRQAAGVLELYGWPRLHFPVSVVGDDLICVSFDFPDVHSIRGT